MFLLQMAGVSGAGKSSLARSIGRHTGAVVIDYDVVKSAALDTGFTWHEAGRIGYGTSRAVADSLLAQGLSVVLDSPCRFQQIVDEGTAIAQSRGAAYAFIECGIVDEDVVRQRMNARERYRSQRVAFDVPPPDAPFDPKAVADYSHNTKYPTSPWLFIDTQQSPEHCLTLALDYLNNRANSHSK